MYNIAIITPVKNEIDNLPKLFGSMEKQTIKIFSWVLIDNDSNDGSEEYLLNIHKIKNIEYFHLLHMSFEDKSYQLGMKYSSIIKYGFNFLKSMDYYDKLNFIGILDSDCFPECNYYEKLSNFMIKDKNIGIASGILLLENGERGYCNKDHVRGSGRLWKKKCFDESGYYIGISADSISRIKAILKGWEAKVDNESIFISREVNSRISTEYKGVSSYYNGFTLLYVLAKSIINICRKSNEGYLLLRGYMKCKINRMPKNNDSEIIEYNRHQIIRKIKKYIKYI